MCVVQLFFLSCCFTHLLLMFFSFAVPAAKVVLELVFVLQLQNARINSNNLKLLSVLPEI